MEIWFIEYKIVLIEYCNKPATIAQSKLLSFSLYYAIKYFTK